jgi:hypothetical protein
MIDCLFVCIFVDLISVLVGLTKLISVLYLYGEDRHRLSVNLHHEKELKEQIVENIYLSNTLPKPTRRSGFSKFNIQDENGSLVTSFDAIVADKNYLFYQSNELIPLPPSKWGKTQLDQLKIHIEKIDFSSFFNLFEGSDNIENNIPLSHVASSLQSTLSRLNINFLESYRTDSTITMQELQLKRNSLMQDEIYEHPIMKSCFLMRKYEDHESIVDSFVSLLFKELGFYEKLLFVFPQLRLPLHFGAVDKEAKADFVIFDLLSYYRIAVVKDKNYESETLFSVPQLTAELISLCQKNEVIEQPNKRSKTTREIDANNCKPLLGIRVNGRSFSFYLFQMTEQLRKAMDTQSVPSSITRLYHLEGRAYDFFDPTERNTIIQILDRIKFDLVDLVETSERKLSKDS